ncbi:hypothetical protein C9374_005020 [Naegleria lovaniensis]|uniref:RasGTPase-activating protein n=1 Tax=Naegleria lovaniensis TaxID=51637 RepID=A0AA88GRX7_NAELO|nr:uncharacterized protein C9374_005020 [Naegleria lovaniensis]KAG2383053.1 hypothetical protein C9374_005020 [Naegleria lovaniensis]
MSNQTKMDLSIAERRAYEFLLRSEEAKRWIEEMIQERFGQGSTIAYFGEMLRDGVALAKLAKIFAPSQVKKINKPNQNTIKLEFSLVDNITQFLNACKSTGFREIYLFEVTDLWELKNVYKVVHCLHSLSLYLFQHGLAIKMERLKSLNVSREDLERTKKMLDDLENSGIKFDQSLIEGDDDGTFSEDLSSDLRSDNIRAYVTGLSDPEMCQVSGDSLTRAVCGVENKFTIHAFDSDGKPLKYCTDTFVVELKSSSTTIHAQVLNNGDGTFTVKYTPQVADEYVMTISLYDEELGDVAGLLTNKNSSDGVWNVKVTANPISDPTKSVLKPSSQHASNNQRSYRAGQAIEDLILESRDLYGNRGAGGEPFSAKLISQTPENVVEAKVVDTRDGYYQLLFKVEKAGNYTLEISRPGPNAGETIVLTQIRDSTKITVHDSGKSDPDNCVFIGLTTNLHHLVDENAVETDRIVSQKSNTVKLERKAGDVIRFLIQARDEFGNVREVDSEIPLPPLISEQFHVIACLEGARESPAESADNLLMTPRTAKVAKQIETFKTETESEAYDSTIVKLPTIDSDSELTALLGLAQLQSGDAQQLESKLHSTLLKFVSHTGHHGLYLVETKLIKSGEYSLQCRVAQGSETSTSTAAESSEEAPKPKQTLLTVGGAHTVIVRDAGVTDASQCVVIQSFAKAENASKTIIVPNLNKMDMKTEESSENPDAFTDTFKKFHAGREMHLIVEARDRYGNAREIAENDEFLVKLTPKTESVSSPISPRGDAKVCHAASTKFVQGKGLFEVVYTVTTAQNYIMEVVYVDKSKVTTSDDQNLAERYTFAQPVKAFPQEVVVTDAAKTDAQNVLFSGTGVTNGVQGKEAFFVMRMRDSFKNLRRQGGDQVEVTVINDARKIETPATEIVDNQDGTYTVRYVAKASGKNRFQIRINGELVQGNDILDAGLFISPPNIEDASNVETILDHDLLSALLNAFRVEQKTDNLVEQIQALRQELVRQLRENTRVGSGVREKERKISLLAENKYHAEELMNQKGGIIGYFQRRRTMQLNNGLDGLSTSAADAMIKENINLYGNLFYLLQTNPKYLAKCIFLVPPSELDQFLNTVTLTLYGYAFNPREEYLILNLFNEALLLEVQNSNLDSFLSGNPILIKLLINYCHERISGKTFLQKVLYDKILDPIIEEKDLNLDLNPITLLREMVSQSEVETGIKSTIDFKEMTYEKAMETNETVRNVINMRKQKMIQICEQILTSIYDNIAELPYGLRFVCRQLRALLLKKHPNTDEKKINQVISYILFFRYLNPPLCAPDGFNLTKKKISAVMRNNLGHISKVLMRITTFREFEPHVDHHMVMMNEWVHNNTGPFVEKFLIPSLQIVEPEEFLGVNQYAELTQKKSPSITITINEIALTHNLLVKFAKRIISQEQNTPDPLSDLLTKFKDKIPEQVDTGKNEEITLLLVPPSNDEKSADDNDDSWLDVTPEQLYELTKENLRTLLKYITPQQLGESVDDTIQKSAIYAEELAKNKETEATASIVKKKIDDISRALPKLEEYQIISKENNYRKLLIDITKEIQNREELQKKQQKEIERLKESLNSLKSYYTFLTEKDASLDEYVQQTLRNYFKKQEKKQESSKNAKSKTYKFSYKKLTEKYKVIQEIQDGGSVNSLQKKAVKFTISMNESEPGVFLVTPTLAGVTITTLKLKLDELLDKREKGVSTIKIEGVVLDVNMTIHLLNKKFLSKMK